MIYNSPAADAQLLFQLVSYEKEFDTAPASPRALYPLIAMSLLGVAAAVAGVGYAILGGVASSLSACLYLSSAATVVLAGVSIYQLSRAAAYRGKFLGDTSELHRFARFVLMQLQRQGGEEEYSEPSESDREGEVAQSLDFDKEIGSYLLTRDVSGVELEIPMFFSLDSDYLRWRFALLCRRRGDLIKTIDSDVSDVLMRVGPLIASISDWDVE